MLRQPSRVYVGLAEQPLVAGAEPRLVLLNIGFLVFMLIAFKAIWWPLVTWVIHQALKAMTKRDPFIRRIYIKYQRQADRYEPWPERKPKRRLRPMGFGRGIL